MTKCPVPGCWSTLWPKNKSGVCRNHVHAAGYCKCPGCQSGNKSGHTGYHVKTREEMQKEGLLP